MECTKKVIDGLGHTQIRWNRNVPLISLRRENIGFFANRIEPTNLSIQPIDLLVSLSQLQLRFPRFLQSLRCLVGDGKIVLKLID